MAPKQNRYKEMEKIMTSALITDGVLFLLYLICAAAGVIWLKVLLAIATIVIALAGLAILYLSQELMRRRSLWLTTGFFSVFLCILVSLILAFP